jgi:hypothetical protein
MRARFLFGEEVVSHLESIRKDMSIVNSFHDVTNRSIEDQKDYKNAEQRLGDFVLNSTKIFEPYMKIASKIRMLDNISSLYESKGLD